MKILISILSLMLAAHAGVAQFFDDSITMDQKGRVPVAIDGFETTVKVDQDIRNNRFVLGGITELKQYKRKKLNFQLENVDSISLSNGNVRKVYHFKVAEITISNVLLTNYPVEFEYEISQKNGKSRLVSNHPVQVGVGYLRLFSNAQVAGNMLKLEDIMCDFNVDPVSCDPSIGSSSATSSPVAATPIPQNTNVTVRIVPCSLTTDVTQLKSQVKNILSAYNITIEEETNVPPPDKALNRISDGLTLRYFADGDKVLAGDYLDKLKQEFTGFSVRDENMVPYFNSPIPSYFEIWIK